MSPICFCMLSTSPTRTPNVLTVSILNFLYNSSKISVACESSFNIYFFSLGCVSPCCLTCIVIFFLLKSGYDVSDTGFVKATCFQYEFLCKLTTSWAVFNVFCSYRFPEVWFPLPFNFFSPLSYYTLGFPKNFNFNFFCFCFSFSFFFSSFFIIL